MPEGTQVTDPQCDGRREPGDPAESGERGEDQAVDHGVEAEPPELRSESESDDRQADEADGDLGPSRTRRLVASGLRPSGDISDSGELLEETWDMVIDSLDLVTRAGFCVARNRRNGAWQRRAGRRGRRQSYGDGVPCGSRCAAVAETNRCRNAWSRIPSARRFTIAAVRARERCASASLPSSA